MLNERSQCCGRSLQCGLSIVEFMVGIAIGLFIVGGAVKLFVDYLSDSRRLLLETRVNQDLRAAADLVLRDLRRAGHWRNATSSMSGAAPVINAYRSTDWTAGVLSYTYAKDTTNSVEGNERFGYRLAGTAPNVLQYRAGTNVGGAPNWQAITDPATVDILAFDVVPTTTELPLFSYCICMTQLTCNGGQFANPDPATGATGIYFATRPNLGIREYAVTILGRSVTAPAVVREVREHVRVRNDDLSGQCPNP